VITVDAKAAGKGKVTCTVSTPDGAELDVDVVENHDGTFDIYYTAPEPGKYVITIRFGGEHIPNSPFHVLACDRMAHVEEPSDVLQLRRPSTYPAPWVLPPPAGATPRPPPAPSFPPSSPPWPGLGHGLGPSWGAGGHEAGQMGPRAEHGAPSLAVATPLLPLWFHH